MPPPELELDALPLELLLALEPLLEFEPDCEPELTFVLAPPAPPVFELAVLPVVSPRHPARDDHTANTPVSVPIPRTIHPLRRTIDSSRVPKKGYLL